MQNILFIHSGPQHLTMGKGRKTDYRPEEELATCRHRTNTGLKTDERNVAIAKIGFM